MYSLDRASLSARFGVDRIGVESGVQRLDSRDILESQRGKRIDFLRLFRNRHLPAAGFGSGSFSLAPGNYGSSSAGSEPCRSGLRVLVLDRFIQTLQYGIALGLAGL